MHFVHYNNDFGSLANARDRPGGLVVVTVLLQLTPQNNGALQPLIAVLPQIINFNSSSVIRGFNFGNILPDNRRLFYRYPGSLTTPPCSETVTFIIFAEPIGISAIQV